MVSLQENTAQADSAASGVPRIAVAGVSGYAGGELVRLLMRHPRFGSDPLLLGREGDIHAGALRLADLHPQLAGSSGKSQAVHPFSWERIADHGTDLLLLATPHEQSRAWVPEALARGLRVIDLSGAWRLHNPLHHAVYQLDDADPARAQSVGQEAVYGCPELHRELIRSARLIANPGCYATSILLALAPLVKEGVIDLEHGIVCDAKSGVSGAGKAATAKTHFMYAADNLSAYSVFGHRHTGELLEQLGLDADQIRFTPHLLPIPRGILSTIYLRLREPADRQSIAAIFDDFYRGSPMVRMHAAGSLPQIQHVVRTSFCDIGFDLSSNGRDLLIVSCLDNLLKGAAAQAVQNLNLMYGWDESEGLL